MIVKNMMPASAISAMLLAIDSVVARGMVMKMFEGADASDSDASEIVVVIDGVCRDDEANRLKRIIPAVDITPRIKTRSRQIVILKNANPFPRTVFEAFKPYLGISF